MMRRLRNAIVTIFELVFDGPFVELDARSQDVTPDLRIVMTGYLLGYYRVPDVQPEDFLDDCELGSKPGDPWANASPAARELAKQRGDLFGLGADSGAILVGMGEQLRGRNESADLLGWRRKRTSSQAAQFTRSKVDQHPGLAFDWGQCWMLSLLGGLFRGGPRKG